MSRSLAIVAVTLLTAFVCLAGDDPVVQPTQIIETRMRQIAKGDPDRWDSPGLTVLLRISGPAIKNARLAEPPKITEAKDDTGADLMPPKDDEIRDGGHFMMGIGEHDEAKDVVAVSVRLKLPARKATRIATLTGQVTLNSGGEEKVVNTAGLAQLVNKDIESADLKAAGVTIRVLPAEDKTGKSLKLRIGGSTQAIMSVDVLDAAGESLVQGTGTSTDEKGVTETTYDLSGPMDAKTTLKVTVLIGQKKVVAPFTLKDVDLP